MLGGMHKGDERKPVSSERGRDARQNLKRRIPRGQKKELWAQLRCISMNMFTLHRCQQNNMGICLYSLFRIIYILLFVRAIWSVRSNTGIFQHNCKTHLIMGSLIGYFLHANMHQFFSFVVHSLICALVLSCHWFQFALCHFIEVSKTMCSFFSAHRNSWIFLCFCISQTFL